jgi:hypothetical protein
MYKYAVHEWFWVLSEIAKATENTAVVVESEEESRNLLLYAMRNSNYADDAPIFWMPYPGIGKLVGFDFKSVIISPGYASIRSNCRDWEANELTPSIDPGAWFHVFPR